MNTFTQAKTPLYEGKTLLLIPP